MMKLTAFVTLVVASATTQIAPVQAQSPYSCTNERLVVNIPGGPANRAIDRFSEQASCPVSRDAKLAGIVTRPVTGRLTPLQALRSMFRGTPITVTAINQGFSVSRARLARHRRADR